MKNSGRCPKCSGSEIVRVPGELTGFGGGNWIRVGATVFSNVKVSRYVCVGCGFLEEWADNQFGSLEQIAKRWGTKRE